VDDGWEFSQIGEGVIDYETVFKELVEKNELLPLSIEHLFMYRASEDFVVKRLQRPPTLTHICTSLRNSMDYVNSMIKKYS
jgi:hypothetical protein